MEKLHHFKLVITVGLKLFVRYIRTFFVNILSPKFSESSQPKIYDYVEISKAKTAPVNIILTAVGLLVVILLLLFLLLKL